jgi:Fic family protein
MNHLDFQNSPSGRCIRTPQGYWAFVPNPLPPHIDYDEGLIALQSEADRLLGELSGIGRVLPNPYLLIAPYIKREAVSSSAIEGTQTLLSDLFFFEAAHPKEPRVPDVREVANYVRAMEHGIRQVANLPISIRLIREIHAVLLEGVRGEEKHPGELRDVQNMIGPSGCSLSEATFVPPPVEEMKQALGEWEKYLHSKPEEPPLVLCALIHYQFEAIHPFCDGNGRVGRLLITFFLCERGYLSQPLLYLSGFFEKFRDEYYSRLLKVSQTGDWRGWIEFFLRGIVEQAKDALADSKKILSLYEEYQSVDRAKKMPKCTHQLIDEVFLNPYVSISTLSDKLNLPYASVKAGVMALVDAGILHEITGGKRNKLFIASKLMNLLTGSEKGRRVTTGGEQQSDHD